MITPNPTYHLLFGTFGGNSQFPLLKSHIAVQRSTFLLRIERAQILVPAHFPSGKGPPPYPSDRRLHNTHSRSGRCGKENNPLPQSRIEPLFLGCPVRSLVALLAELHRLPKVGLLRVRNANRVDSQIAVPSSIHRSSLLM
jgi:hypothetical protein